MLTRESTHTENGLYSEIGYIMAPAIKSVKLKKTKATTTTTKKHILKIMMREKEASI